MVRSIYVHSVLVACAAIAGCGEQRAPDLERSPKLAATSVELEQLKAENAKLKAQVLALTQKVEELSLTPQTLLNRVIEALDTDKISEARSAASALDARFSGSTHAKAAQAALSKYEAAIAAREAQAKALEARGFFALQPQNAPTVGNVTVRVESLQLGGRWQFDVHGDEWHYRDAQRGERFVLLRTTLESTVKNPSLPDIGVYLVHGKKLIRLDQMRYEFRRWSSYGTFIGLHHDFKNDFAHTPAIPFNAAARISENDAKSPLAVVLTDALCHDRDKKIGQPEVAYKLSINCPSKSELEADDFTKGGYRVLAFFNRPKGQ